MSKRIKNSYASLLSLIFISSSIFSCNNYSINDFSNLDKNQDFKVGNGSGSVKLKININKDDKNFKIKASENGSPAKTKASNLYKVTLKLSTNPTDPYNNPTGTSLDITTALTSFPKDLTISGLDPNNTYYLSARAFDSSSNNITKGDTVVSSEQVQVLANGAINILNDFNTNNIWDITINLLDGYGASIDSEIYIKDGTKGNFNTKEEIVNTDIFNTTQVNSRASVNDYGNGLIAYETVNSTGVENISGRFISDYRLNASEFLLESNSISNSSFRYIEHPDIKINNKGNGLVVWNQEDNGLEVIRYRKIENYKTLGTEFDLESSEFKQKHYPTIGFQKKIEGTQRSSIIIWREAATLPNYDLKAIILRTSNNDFSGTLNISTETVINNGSAQNNLEPQVSQIGNSNKCMLVWTKNVSGIDKVYTKVLSLDSNAIPGFSVVPSSIVDKPITQNVSNARRNASISLNDNGDGLIVWEEDNFSKKVIFYKRITNYGFNDNVSVPIGFQVSSLSSTSYDQTKPKVSLDSFGNGLVVWSDDRDFTENTNIYGRKIVGYEPVGQDFKINTSTTNFVQNNISLSLNDQLSGVVTWDDAQGSSLDIYSRRILNINPE